MAAPNTRQEHRRLAPRLHRGPLLILTQLVRPPGFGALYRTREGVTEAAFQARRVLSATVRAVWQELEGMGYQAQRTATSGRD